MKTCAKTSKYRNAGTGIEVVFSKILPAEPRNIYWCTVLHYSTGSFGCYEVVTLRDWGSKFGLFAKSVRVLEVTSLSVVLHRSASASAARNTTRLANKSLSVPRKKVRDELRARGLRANFAHLIARNYLYLQKEFQRGAKEYFRAMVEFGITVLLCWGLQCA